MKMAKCSSKSKVLTNGLHLANLHILRQVGGSAYLALTYYLIHYLIFMLNIKLNHTLTGVVESIKPRQYILGRDTFQDGT